MESSFIQKYFFSALLIVAFALGFVLFWPYLKVIMLAIVFSVLLSPLYRWFKKIVRFPRVASLLTIISFLVILCIPVYFVGTIVLKQTESMYTWVISHDAVQTAISSANVRLAHLFPDVSFNLQDRFSSTIATLTGKLGSVFTATFSTLISLILMLLSMFYFLKDGPAWKESLIQLSPLSFESNTTVVAILKKTISGIVKGYFVVGLAQGITTGIGLYLFHVPHPALWGVLAAFSSLIPGVGSALVSIPVLVFLFVTHRIGAGFGYLAWAVLFSMSIDNILNPYVVGRQISIHPLLVLFSILGGIALMGPIGIIIGPLITSFIYALIAVYKLEMATDSV